MAAVVEDALAEALGERLDLVDAGGLRDAQRRLRMRDPGAAHPASLARLAGAAGAQWLFAATLHRATEKDVSRSLEAFYGRGAGHVPQVTLAAVAYRVEGDEAVFLWSGFAAASGLDSRRILGLGAVEDGDELARRAARHLVDAFVHRVDGRSAQPLENGFRRRPLTPSAVGPVAVLPFRGVTDRDATRAADTVTDLAAAVLHGAGVRLLEPGVVRDVLRRQEVEVPGDVPAAVRRALAEAGASTVLTGCVEGWELRGVTEPDPYVALGARLVDARDGRILWMNGGESHGRDHEKAFGAGRVHGRGVLAEHLMRRLVAGLLDGKSTRTPGEAP